MPITGCTALVARPVCLARCHLQLVSNIAAAVAYCMVAAMVDFLAMLAARNSSQLFLGFVRSRHAALVA